MLSQRPTSDHIAKAPESDGHRDPRLHEKDADFDLSLQQAVPIERFPQPKWFPQYDIPRAPEIPSP